MKLMDRSYVWWSSIDHDIENLAKSCSGCANKLYTPAKSQLHPWSYLQLLENESILTALDHFKDIGTFCFKMIIVSGQK